jgi:hypothetical protein
VIKTEPQAQSRVKQEQLDDSVVGHVKQEPLDDPVVGRVKQEPLDDPVAADDLRAQWEADLQVKEEEDDDDPGEEQYPEEDADDDEEEEEEEEEGDEVAEAQSGRDDYGSAEEDADLVTQIHSQTGQAGNVPLLVPDSSLPKREPSSPAGTWSGVAVKREVAFEDPQNGANSPGGPFAWPSSSPFEETSMRLFRRLGQLDAEMSGEPER